MATWKQIRDYVFSILDRSPVYDEENDAILIDMDGGKKVQVIQRRELGQNDVVDCRNWLAIYCPIGEVSKNDIFDLLNDAEDWMSGGVVAHGNTCFFVCRVPMDWCNLDSLADLLVTLEVRAETLTNDYAKQRQR